MIAVGNELAGIASRLTNQPKQESATASQPLQVLRGRLNAVIEPDRSALRNCFHSVLTSVMQWHEPRVTLRIVRLRIRLTFAAWSESSVIRTRTLTPFES